jgi:photosynthetic reaction center cytochrome c subunit
MRLLLPMLLVLLPLCAQQGGPKNLKVLKPEDLRAGAMRNFTIALGQNCGFCHVQGDQASDEKPEKLTARKMILMVREINAQFPDGKEHVTCYTCHRGAPEPLTAPPAN